MIIKDIIIINNKYILATTTTEKKGEIFKQIQLCNLIYFY
jgi:hypothetical protein